MVICFRKLLQFPLRHKGKVLLKVPTMQQEQKPHISYINMDFIVIFDDGFTFDTKLLENAWHCKIPWLILVLRLQTPEGSMGGIMQHPGPLDEALCEARSKCNPRVPQSHSYNLTIWYIDIWSHPVLYRIEIQLDAVTDSFLPWQLILTSPVSLMYGESTTSTTPCMFSYAWYTIGYDRLRRLKKKKNH